MDDIHYKNDESSVLSTLIFFSRFICHRIPERTFQFKGLSFPVCSRCTGMYIGVFSYFTYVYFFYVQYTIFIILIAFLMLIPIVIDGFTQFFNLRESNNILRLFTGLIGGFGLGILVKAAKFMFFVIFLF